MNNKACTRLLTALVLALLSLVPPAVRADDIDIFTGASSGGGAANVLIIIDNTSNWSRQDQQWPGGITQGQSELLSLKSALADPKINDQVNVGLMLFVDQGSGRMGGYVRYAMRPMNPANKSTLQSVLQGIYDNFGTPGEKVGSSANYSGVLFDAYKYFGGYTSPAHAHDDVAGTPLGATTFGTLAHATASLIPLPVAGATYMTGPDPAAYTNWSNPPPAGDTLNYQPPAVATDTTCGGRDFIVFVGNGFPNQDTLPGDDLSAFLAGVGGDPSQIDLNTFTTITSPTPTSIGYSSACYANTISGKNSGLGACNADYSSGTASCPSGYSTCTCAASPTLTSGCPTPSNPSKQTVQFPLFGTTTTVTPTGQTAPPANNVIRYADEWTRFMHLTDVNSAAGQQNVTTFTIDVFNAKQDANQTALLYSMATSAGGQYFAAKNQNQLTVAFGQIFQQILAVNTAFASASLPVNTTNRAQNLNEVFIGMFRPDTAASPVWYGNVKRYQIANFNGDFKLADVNKLDAVNPLTGFFTDCATSFWTTDSGKYWSGLNGNSSAGACPSGSTTFDPFSDSPDGPLVEKGSVAEVLRRGNNPPATVTTPTWSLNRNIYTKNFASFTSANSSMTQPDVDFISGLDVNSLGSTLTHSFVDPAGNTESTTIRSTIHGDVVHSRPLPVNYGSTTGTVVYYGANDGTYRAVDAATGKELWAYVAPEFYSTLGRLRQGTPLVTYPSTLRPCAPNSVSCPKDYFFDGSTGLYQNADNSNVWIFPSMRRGGRMLYAFDVTTPTSPSLLWKVGCPDLYDDNNCTTGMSGIGQTWSTPNAATLKVGGTAAETPTPIIAVGGGYDNCEDGAAANACTGAKGSIVYILNAATGAVLNSFPTDGRVVADIALVDLDVDGIPDLGYVVDTRGNIYRINFGLSKSAPLAASAWTMTKIAYTAGANRKFLYAPALLAASGTPGGGGPYFVYLALGSGDREEPLSSQYPFTTPVLNRFYVFLDDTTKTPATPADAANLDDSSTSTDLTMDPGCGGTVLIPGASKPGWYMDLDVCGPGAADCTAGSTTKGEQVVTSAVIVGGLVAFSTNRAIPPQPNVCAPRGEARGYLVNLFNSSGTVGSADATCGAARSSPFVGGGLPPSPVVGTILVDGYPVNVLLGAANKKGETSTAFQSQQAFTLKPQKRNRIYDRQEGNN